MLTWLLLSLTYLCVQLALALLQLRNTRSALSQHSLLLLQGKLQLQVLLTLTLTNQAGAVELPLQRGYLNRKDQG